MTRKIRIQAAFATVLAAALWATPAATQPMAEAFGAKLMLKMQAARTTMMRERLALDAGTHAKVEKIFAEFDPKRMAARQQMRTHMMTLRALAEAPTSDTQALQKTLDALVAARREQQALKAQEFDALRAVLTPLQQAKLLIALHDLKKNLRGKMGGMMGGGMMGGPGGN